AGCQRPGAGTRIRTVVGVRAVEAGAAAVEGLHDEVEAVERVQLEVAERLVKQCEVHVDSAAVILQASLERVVDLRLELKVGTRRNTAAAIDLGRRGADRSVA